MTAIERPDPPDTPGEFIPRIELPSDAEIKAGLRASLARIQAEEHNAEIAAARLSPEDIAAGTACTVTPIAGLPKPRAPADLDEALAAATDGLAGITAAQFKALLSPEDLDDIAAGDIPVETLHAYAESFAEGMRSGRIVVPGGEP